MSDERIYSFDNDTMSRRMPYLTWAVDRRLYPRSGQTKY